MAAILQLLVSESAFAQSSPDQVWSRLGDQELNAFLSARRSLKTDIVPDKYQAFFFDIAQFESIVSQAPLERLDLDPSERPAPETIWLPLPDGEFGRFEYVESPIMHPDLAARYPEIRTFLAQGIDDPTATVRFDLTPFGFHAQILSARGAIYVDPFYGADTCVSYYKRDYVPIDKEFQCFVSGDSPAGFARVGGPSRLQSGDTLRTYRLALACTGEYAAFHGGTLLLVSAAMATTVSRVVGIYENELAIRLVLVANNDNLIYFDSATDPYTNNNASTLLTQNQATIDSVIGNSNYDIGHVFGTGGGGLASLGVVCNNAQKAQGETGSSAPTGDAFDVDYVAHEMGHQFSGNHTFNGVTNNCSGSTRNAATAYEPGSGSTIQAYAGICGVDNLQVNSDPYFHSASFQEMFGFVFNTATCATLSATGNAMPTASAGLDYTIPKGTPFALTGTGTDSDSSGALTFCWEQWDLGPAALLTAADDGNIPLFRSISPAAANLFDSYRRYFPKLTDVVAGTLNTSEKIPQLARSMDFRLTVRDNRAGGGGVQSDDMVVTVDGTAGPFALTSPNGGETVPPDAYTTVTWNVAGTDQAPIDTSMVRFYLSFDSGATFDYLLNNFVINDGSQSLWFPDVANAVTTARLMIQAEDNIYYDVSDADFTIDNPPAIAPLIQPMLDTVVPDDGLYWIFADLAQGSDPITWSIVSPNPLPDDLAISNVGGFEGKVTWTADIAESPLDITVQASGPGGIDTESWTIEVTPISRLSSSNVPVTTLDGDTVSSTIAVPSTLVLADVNATVNITHTRDAEVFITLTSPLGTVVQLVNGRGGEGDNFTNTTFDDEAGPHISSGSPPFTGSYRSEQFLFSFDGQDAQGTWTLSVADSAATSATGTITGWSLTLTPVPTKLVWVDFHDSGGIHIGTRLDPYTSLPQALSVVEPNGTIRFKPGFTNTTPTINQPVTLQNGGGGLIMLRNL